MHKRDTRMTELGIKGIHHVGISVPNLERAVEFYSGTLGLELVDRWDFACNSTIDQLMSLRGASAKTVMLAAGNIYLEIFEFSVPNPNTQDALRPVCDHGYTHLAFEVENIFTTYAKFENAGVHWHSPLADDIEADGSITTAYGRDPFGNVIEIQQLAPKMKFHVSELPRWHY